jgi:hypothetical protein
MPSRGQHGTAERTLTVTRWFMFISLSLQVHASLISTDDNECGSPPRFFTVESKSIISEGDVALLMQTQTTVATLQCEFDDVLDYFVD